MISSREITNLFVHFEFTEDDKTRSILVKTEKFCNYLNEINALPISGLTSFKGEDNVLYYKGEENNNEIPYSIITKAIDLLDKIDDHSLMKAILHFEQKQKVEL